MMSCLDEGVENLTQTLQEAGMWEDTIFIFFSGNNIYSYFHTMCDYSYYSNCWGFMLDTAAIFILNLVVVSSVLEI